MKPEGKTMSSNFTQCLPALRAVSFVLTGDRQPLNEYVRQIAEVPVLKKEVARFIERPELQDIARAKALCAKCPVLVPCLEGALERREPWGVWGGELFLRGTTVPRKRPRGRPRKEDAELAKADERAA